MDSLGLFSKLGDVYRSLNGMQPIDTNMMKAEPMFMDDISQVGAMNLQKSNAVREQKAYLEDPLGLVNAMGFKDRPYSLSYDVLRRMASRNAVIASILTTRVNQVSSFTRPARFDRSGVGYEISLRDPNETPSKEDEKTILAIEKFLENTGYTDDNERDDFDTFIRKIVRDRLIFDQTCFEIVPDRKGRPAEFYAVDASTIRVATEHLNETTNWKEAGLKRGEEIKYVQLINGTIQTYFTANELAFGVANPRTDINIAPYGFSELEMLIHQVTSHLWAEQYNSRFFSQGGTTKGILNLKPTQGEGLQRQQLESFKRQWLSQVSGMTGAWKTPVISVDGVEYINVSQSNREMEFEKWMNYLINIACAVYQVDPAEINFPNRGGAGNTGGGGLGNGGIEDRLQHSKDKGLRPLLRFIEMLINKYIVSRFDNRFVFTFVGIDAKSESEIVDLQQKQVKVFKTVNEIRKEEDLPPLEGGDIILDANFVSMKNAQAQQEMMKQNGGFGQDFNNNNNNDDKEDNEDVQTDKQENTDKPKDDKKDDDVNKSETKFITFEFID